MMFAVGGTLLWEELFASCFDSRKMMKVVLWICGILACGIFGGFVGSLVVGPLDSDSLSPVLGFIAGAAAFTGERLWYGERKKGFGVAVNFPWRAHNSLPMGGRHVLLSGSPEAIWLESNSLNRFPYLIREPDPSDRYRRVRGEGRRIGEAVAADESVRGKSCARPEFTASSKDRCFIVERARKAFSRDVSCAREEILPRG
jgi:hypothetical protein